MDLRRCVREDGADEGLTGGERVSVHALAWRHFAAVVDGALSAPVQAGETNT